MRIIKITVLVSLAIATLVFFGVKVFDNRSNEIVEEHFPDSTLPDEVVAVGEKFELEQGQRATVSDTNVSIRYSGTISAPPAREEPVYDFVYNGSSTSYTTTPYNVSVVFGSDGSSSAVFSVSSVESECQSGSVSEQDQCWLDLAGRTNDTSYCAYIVSEITRDSCLYADVLAAARDTFFTQIVIVSNPVVSPSSVADTVREMCEGSTYSSGVCLIIGAETVLTPQQCADLVEGGEDMGTEFYEDCFSISMYVYGPDEEVCAGLEDPDLMESCLTSVEESKT